MRTGVPGGRFVASGTGSVSGVHGVGGMKTGSSGGGGGMRQSRDCVPHGAVASGGAMRTGMAVGVGDIVVMEFLLPTLIWTQKNLTVILLSMQLFQPIKSKI